MNLLHVKGTIAVLWALSVLTLGLVGHATSMSSWLTLAMMAALPPTILMHRWSDPTPTTTQIIREALR